MKKILFFISLTIIIFPSFGQQIEKKKRVVSLAKETLVLNGGVRSAFGGKSRTAITIDLPPNTLEWYYVFSTSPVGGQNKALNLVPQLTRLIDPMGVSSLVASAILAPTGSHVCDIYLMDQLNSNSFLQKLDNSGRQISCIESGKTENARQAVIQIKDVRAGRWFLGFKNPSETEGIVVNVEVAAIVEERDVDYSVWAKETKDRFYQTYYTELKSKNMADDIAKDLANCLVEKISSKITPEDYNKLAVSERNAMVKDLYAECVTSAKAPKTPEQEKGSTYGTLGWNAYRDGDIDKCIEFSKKALTFDNTLGWVQSNLGLCFLIKGDENMATGYYVDAISNIKALKFASMIQKQLKAAICDIDDALTKKPDLKGSGSIKGLLQEELRRYDVAR